MKLQLLVFQKKYLFGVNRLFWTQSYCASSKLRIHSKEFLKILHSEKGQEAHKNHIFIERGTMKGPKRYTELKLILC